MMGTSAKRHFRALVASAIFAAMLGLGSGTASATAFLEDFTADPTGGAFVTSFSTAGGFDFVFTGAGVVGGDGGDFGHVLTGGDANSNYIVALSFATAPAGLGTQEIITIKLTGGGTFTWETLYLDIFGSVAFPSQAVIVEGLLGGGSQFLLNIPSSTVTVVTNVNTGVGGVPVDTVEIRSNEFFLTIIDTFTGQFAMGPMAMPEPGTLALFLTGLIGLGLLSRRRRRSA